MHDARPDLPAFSAIDAAMRQAVDRGELPGGMVRIEVGRPGRVVAYERAVGLLALQPQVQALETATVYDTASLTKVVITAPVLMRLVEGGSLELGCPVRQIVPAFEAGDDITVRHLLTHTSGLPAGLPLESSWAGHDAAVELACCSRPTHPPDGVFRYSDVNFVLLGDIAQRLTGRPLDALAQDWILGPLRMRDSGFLPLRRLPSHRIAPTECVEAADVGGAAQTVAHAEGAAADLMGVPGQPMRQWLRGTVHDPTARRMGGVAGHAGLFSTVADIARFARMVLEGGTLDGATVLRESTVAQMTAVATPASLSERRSLGWDIDTPLSRARGRHPRPGSFGHTGFTGCVLWIDPPRHSFHVLLTNRVHPVARQSIVALYEEIGTRVAEAAAQAGPSL